MIRRLFVIGETILLSHQLDMAIFPFPVYPPDRLGGDSNIYIILEIVSESFQFPRTAYPHILHSNAMCMFCETQLTRKKMKLSLINNTFDFIKYNLQANGSSKFKIVSQGLYYGVYSVLHESLIFIALIRVCPYGSDQHQAVVLDHHIFITHELLFSVSSAILYLVRMSR